MALIRITIRSLPRKSWQPKCLLMYTGATPLAVYAHLKWLLAYQHTCLQIDLLHYILTSLPTTNVKNDCYHLCTPSCFHHLPIGFLDIFVCPFLLPPCVFTMSLNHQITKMTFIYLMQDSLVPLCFCNITSLAKIFHFHSQPYPK